MFSRMKEFVPGRLRPTERELGVSLAVSRQQSNFGPENDNRLPVHFLFEAVHPEVPDQLFASVAIQQNSCLLCRRVDHIVVERRLVQAGEHRLVYFEELLAERFPLTRLEVARIDPLGGDYFGQELTLNVKRAIQFTAYPMAASLRALG
jgi:hypothetical protein